MSSFTRGAWWPTGRTIRGRAEVCITTPFRFGIGAEGSPWFVDVEAGFTFDQASIPHFSRHFLPVGSIEVPSAVHDRCRQTPWMPLWLGNLVFLHAMWVYGTPKHWAVVVCAATFMSARRT